MIRRIIAGMAALLLAAATVGHVLHQEGLAEQLGDLAFFALVVAVAMPVFRDEASENTGSSRHD